MSFFVESQRPIEQHIYLSNLVTALKYAPVASENRISQVTRFQGYKDLGRYLKQLMEIYASPHDPDWDDLLGSHQNLGFEIGNWHIHLEPVNVVTLLETNNLPPVLEHEGLLLRGSTNNMEQIATKGVWGSMSMTDPTYVRVLGSTVAPEFAGIVDLQPVKLFLDPHILMEYRSVFCDPEQLLFKYEHSKLGEGFFVLGGIPAQAIMGVGPTESTFEQAVKIR